MPSYFRDWHTHIYFNLYLMHTLTHTLSLSPTCGKSLNSHILWTYVSSLTFFICYLFVASSLSSLFFCHHFILLGFLIFFAALPCSRFVYHAYPPLGFLPPRFWFKSCVCIPLADKQSALQTWQSRWFAKNGTIW